MFSDRDINELKFWHGRFSQKIWTPV
jgi:hypothetical protein